jgi:AcrR family transcriptional regulator
MQQGAHVSRRSAPAPRVRLRNRRGEGTRLREDLIAAARELLSGAESESDVSIRKVTRAVDVTPQALYLQFETLDELLFAVYSAEFTELRSALEAVTSGLAPGPAALRAMCHAYVTFAAEHPSQYRLMMSVRGRVHEDWDPTKLPGAPVIMLLNEAIAASALDPEGALSLDAAVTLLWATLHGIVSLRDSRPTFPWPPLPQMVDQAVASVVARVRRTSRWSGRAPRRAGAHPRSRPPGPVGPGAQIALDRGDRAMAARMRATLGPGQERPGPPRCRRGRLSAATRG